MEWYWFVAVFLVAFVGAIAATPLSMKLARRFDAIDYPDGRRVNTQPIPRLGGIAIFVGLALATSVIVITNWVQPELLNIRGLAPSINYYGVLAAALVMFITGLLDDLFQIRALIKFLGQIVAAVIACASGVLFSHFLNPLGVGVVDIGLFAYPFTVFYLVAFANIINLIDGLDGLASGIVAICAATLFCLSLSRQGIDAAIVALAITAVCLGFLLYNFHPAKVFLGDSGSLLLGFSLGLVSLFGVVRASALISLLIPVVIAGVPVIDTFTSIVRRIRAKKPVFSADKQHVHHRFINLGFSQRTTVLIIYGLSIVLAILAALIAGDHSFMRFVYGGILIVVVALFIWRLGLMSSVLTHHYQKRHKHEGYEEQEKHEEHEGSSAVQEEESAPKP